MDGRNERDDWLSSLSEHESDYEYNYRPASEAHRKKLDYMSQMVERAARVRTGKQIEGDLILSNIEGDRMARNVERNRDEFTLDNLSTPESVGRQLAYVKKVQEKLRTNRRLIISRGLQENTQMDLLLNLSYEYATDLEECRINLFRQARARLDVLRNARLQRLLRLQLARIRRRRQRPQ